MYTALNEQKNQLDESVKQDRESCRKDKDGKVYQLFAPWFHSVLILTMLILCSYLYFCIMCIWDGLSYTQMSYCKGIIVVARTFEIHNHPMLECALCVWSSHLIHDLKLIESLLRKFTRHLPKLHYVSLAEKLKQLDFTALDCNVYNIISFTLEKIWFGQLSLWPNLLDDLYVFTWVHLYESIMPCCSSDVNENLV